MSAQDALNELVDWGVDLNGTNTNTNTNTQTTGQGINSRKSSRKPLHQFLLDTTQRPRRWSTNSP